MPSGAAQTPADAATLSAAASGAPAHDPSVGVGVGTGRTDSDLTGAARPRFPSMLALRLWFSAALLGMLGIIVWASGRCALFDIPREVYTHPWFVATLLDAYLAFVAFWVWVAWKETSAAARVLWLGAILLWGNPAVALYMLLEIARAHREGGGPEAVFTRKRAGRVALPAILFVLGVVVYLFGAKNVLFA